MALHEDDPIFPSSVHEDDPIFPSEMEAEDSLTPTISQESLAPTIVQESVLPAEPAEPEMGSSADDYCGWLAPPQAPADTESPYDSQLTSRGDAISRRALQLEPAPYHFTADDGFRKSVDEEIAPYIDESWIGVGNSLSCLWLGRDWDRNVQICSNDISVIASSALEFKIGICRDPRWRFFECARGEYAKRFTKMILIYVADCSKKHLANSSGKMERAQIAIFRDRYSGCLNVGDGGEGASPGSPHFMYVVWN
jgi:hypothetical protein